jgi:hypothetical protein
VSWHASTLVRTIAFARLASLGVLLAGCVLPSFERGEASDAGPSGADVDAGPDPGPACGLSDELPDACDRCIRLNCCDLASACGEGTACGEDLLEPITPAADFSTDFDPLLGCMQRECNVECDVDFGCVDDYRWPTLSEPSTVPVKVIDFAAEPDLPLEDFTVKACQALDPSCESGKVDEAQTDADGIAELTLPPGFSGFFEISGGDYVESTAQWSEPVHRASGFTHYMLRARDINALALVTGVHTRVDEPFEPGSGHLIFRVEGCLPLRYLAADERPIAEVSGVHVEFAPNDFGSDIFYTDGSGSVSLTLEETSADGVGGAFEVPARNLTVTATDVRSGRSIATGSVAVRPGALGFAYLAPRSSP